MKQQAGGYAAALYCRLSKDDGKIEESSSIATQRDMLMRYAKENGYRVGSIYIDDGYSGTNYNRPEFQRMLADIEDGKINLVIVKDLSRLGRNYLETGMYIEVYFPRRDVRFIALNDNVDTAHTVNTDIAPFKNILNEMYAKDLSRKVSTAKRSRFEQGKFMAAAAPYGYRKDPNDRNHLVIDEEIAPIVRRIFQLAKEGYGIAAIRRVMTDEKVLRPCAVTYANTGNFDRYFSGMDDENLTIWSNNSVRGILRNPVYAGHLAGYKRPIPSMKSTRRLSAKPEEWPIVYNTHEAIIPPDEWELVQRLITSRRKGKVGNSGYDNVFSNIVKCADCGYAMTTHSANRAKRPDPIDNMMYLCNNYRTYGKSACSNHYIEARIIHNTVLGSIRAHARMAIEDDAGMLDRIMKKANARVRAEIAAMEREMRKAKARLLELDRLFTSLYEDKTNGAISERNFMMLSQKYEDEQAALDQRISDQDEILQRQATDEDNAAHFISTIRYYIDLFELDAATVNRLIDKITIGEKYRENGELRQEICIYYKFIGHMD